MSLKKPDIKNDYAYYLEVDPERINKAVQSTLNYMTSHYARMKDLVEYSYMIETYLKGLLNRMKDKGYLELEDIKMLEYLTDQKEVQIAPTSKTTPT